ncbi:HAD family phosphatase [Georgenia satyanarayanai]|uniref:HAD family hydrolase n=1 Tax=Georgenia satyanarayanai TaxID=860221 RepID=UPI002041C28E|nr:HAD family phosphatase [Georgenia satyanarayanai]MCM3659868.1 HAD family phosphatase [Georgenia satyanarayanai]
MQSSVPLTGPITTVVFDLGQVLVRWDPYEAFAERWTREEFDAFHAEIDFPSFNHEQDAGRTFADARAALERTHPHRADDFDHYVTNFARSLGGPVPGTTEIVEELIAADIRVLGLTNWSAENFHEAARSVPVIDQLEAVLVSGEVGVAKPDPAIYDLLIQRFKLDPPLTVFTDDSLRNVDAASGAGLVARHFTGAEQLRADLRELGLPV